MSLTHPRVNIQYPSAPSLLLRPTANGQPLSTATGFVVSWDATHYLITNWHVLAGRDRLTGQPLASSCATPDSVTIRHHKSPQMDDSFEWIDVAEPLADPDGRPLWREHPKFGRRVDVVALPLTQSANVALAEYPLTETPELAMRAVVSDSVNIVGFPFGITAGGSFPIWVRGFIATERAVDFDDLPCFLVDARTRTGQSGSPVVLYAPEGAAAMADGSMSFGGPTVELLGVYSGRVNSQSDLGHVWKMKALHEILINGVPGNGDLRTPARDCEAPSGD